MKRTALILGIAAGLAVPAAASAGNSLQVNPQVTAQIVTTQIAKPQIAKPQIAKPQIVRAQRVDAGRVTAQRATGHRISLGRSAR